MMDLAEIIRGSQTGQQEQEIRCKKTWPVDVRSSWTGGPAVFYCDEVLRLVFFFFLAVDNSLDTCAVISYLL